MRTMLIGVVALSLLSLGVGCSLQGSTQAQALPAAQATVPATADTDATAAPTAPPVRAPGAPVVVNGVVVPAVNHRVRFPLPGMVSAVLVEEGQPVKVGDVLATLDTRDTRLEIERLELKVRQAALQLETMKVTPSDEEIQVSQSRVDSARANLREVQASLNAQDIEAANQSLASSRQGVTEIADGPRQEDLAIAQAAVSQAQSQLQNTRDTLSAMKTDYQLQLTLKANELRNRQDTYSRIFWRNRGIERDGELSPAEADDEARALRAVSDGEVDLQRAQIAYDDTVKAEQAGIAAAQAGLADAQARLDRLLAGPEQSERSAAAAVAAREAATLERLTGESRAASLDNARAKLVEAEAALALLKSKPGESDLAQADLGLQIARLELKEAQLSLEMSTIRSPINGTVAIMGMHSGDNTESAFIQVAELGTWQIETSPMNELDVVRLREGSVATMTFVALPGVELTGKVLRVGIIVQPDGKAAYRAVIVPDRQDDRLHWNMSASVSITSE